MEQPPDINSNLWIDVNVRLPSIYSENRVWVKRKKKSAHAGEAIWETWAANVHMSLDNVGWWCPMEKDMVEFDG
jgi:hypothetical protein